MPFTLTDEELKSFATLAAALPPQWRAAFLEVVAAKLAHNPEAREPGAMHRIAVETQRQILKDVKGDKPEPSRAASDDEGER